MFKCQLTQNEGYLEECWEREPVNGPKYGVDDVVCGEGGDDGDEHLHKQEAEEGSAAAVSKTKRYKGTLRVLN